MNWLRTFPPSSYVGNVVNELRSELRFYEAGFSGEEDYASDAEYYFDLGWYTNTKATIERLEEVVDEIRSLEG